MGLVDGEQRDVDIADALQEGLTQQPLGTDIEQIEFIGMQPRQHLTGLLRFQRRIVEGGGHTVGAQRIDLVLHQRDQRRDHNADAAPMQRRNLVAQRLASAGGHQHKGIAPFQQAFDDLLLMGTERGKPNTRRRVVWMSSMTFFSRVCIRRIVPAS